MPKSIPRGRSWPRVFSKGELAKKVKMSLLFFTETSFNPNPSYTGYAHVDVGGMYAKVYVKNGVITEFIG